MKSPPLPTRLFYTIHQAVLQEGTAPGLEEQKLLRSWGHQDSSWGGARSHPGRGRMQAEQPGKQMQRAQEQGTSRDFAEAAGVQHLLGMWLWDRAGGS